MRAYRKAWNYNVCECRYCLYWKGLRRGCTYGVDCCWNIPQTPSKPKRYKGYNPLLVSTSVSECVGCPYRATQATHRSRWSQMSILTFSMMTARTTPSSFKTPFTRKGKLRLQHRWVCLTA